MEGNIGGQLVPISCLHVYIQLMHPYTCVYTCINTQNKNVNLENKTIIKGKIRLLYGVSIWKLCSTKKAFIQIYPGLENECS